jgi:hypothetical protein
MIWETPNFKVTNIILFENKEKHPWSDREGNRGGRDYIMHEREKIQSGGWEGYEWVRWTKDEGSGRRTPYLKVTNIVQK